MSHYSSLINPTDQYGIDLLKVAQHESQVAEVQQVFSASLEDGYIRILADTIESHKDYEKLLTKLENRRLDFDAKLNKVQKIKREDSGLEESTRAAQAKYEETLESVTDKMVELNGLNGEDDSHRAALSEFVDIQCRYFEECAAIMRRCKEQVADKSISAPSFRPVSKIVPRPESVAQASEDGTRTSPPQRVQSFGRNSPAPAGAVVAVVSQVPARPSSMAKGGLRQVRVIFDFEAENGNELSLRIGETVTITEEIDQYEGWCVGSVNGTNRTGMFPSNHTEPLQSEAIMPPRPISLAKPVVSYTEPKPTLLKAPPPAVPSSFHHDQRQAVLTPPPSSYTSTQPAFRVNSSDRGRSASQVPPSGAMMPPSRQRSISDNKAMGGGGSGAAPKCRECACQEYAPHAFKANQCNNCYHAH